MQSQTSSKMNQCSEFQEVTFLLYQRHQAQWIVILDSLYIFNGIFISDKNVTVKLMRRKSWLSFVENSEDAFGFLGDRRSLADRFQEALVKSH